MQTAPGVLSWWEERGGVALKRKQRQSGRCRHEGRTGTRFAESFLWRKPRKAGKSDYGRESGSQENRSCEPPTHLHTTQPRLDSQLIPPPSLPSLPPIAAYSLPHPRYRRLRPTYPNHHPCQRPHRRHRSPPSRPNGHGRRLDRCWVPRRDGRDQRNRSLPRAHGVQGNRQAEPAPARARGREPRSSPQRLHQSGADRLLRQELPQGRGQERRDHLRYPPGQQVGEPGDRAGAGRDPSGAGGGRQADGGGRL